MTNNASFRFLKKSLELFFMDLKNKILVFLVYFLISFPCGYYTYKYGSPDIGGQNDFYSLYPLYRDFDISSVETPFNTRLLSSFFIFIVSKTGIFYDVPISYQHQGIEQNVFFSAILINYLAAVFTCFLIFLTVWKYCKNSFLSFAVGSLYFFEFGTVFWGLTGLADSFSAMLFAGIFLFYLDRSYWAIPLLGLSVFQREIIFFIMGPIALIDLIFKDKKKYFFTILLLTALFFLVYFILRKTVFDTPRWNKILEPGTFFDVAFSPTISVLSYLRQSVINQNILILYLGIIIYKWVKRIKTNNLNLMTTVIVYAGINLISFALLSAGNAGRYFYIGSAFLLYYLAIEIRPLFFTENKLPQSS